MLLIVLASRHAAFLSLSTTLANTGMKADKIIQRPRLLSDNGPCYISGELKEYLKDQKMFHTRGRPFHPQTQGKIERYHRSMKNIIHLDNYYLPQELEVRISEWVDYYNNSRAMNRWGILLLLTSMKVGKIKYFLKGGR